MSLSSHSRNNTLSFPRDPETYRLEMTLRKAREEHKNHTHIDNIILPVLVRVYNILAEDDTIDHIKRKRYESILAQAKELYAIGGLPKSVRETIFIQEKVAGRKK